MKPGWHSSFTYENWKSCTFPLSTTIHTTFTAAEHVTGLNECLQKCRFSGEFRDLAAQKSTGFHLREEFESHRLRHLEDLKHSISG